MSTSRARLITLYQRKSTVVFSREQGRTDSRVGIFNPFGTILVSG